MTEYKLMPMEPAEEVLDAIRFRVGSIDRDEADEIYYLIMTTSPDVQRHPATPSFLEYPSFEESANFDPVPNVPDVSALVGELTTDLSERMNRVSSRSLDGSVVMSSEEWNGIVELVNKLLIADHRKGGE